MQKLINKHLDEHYALGNKSIYRKGINCSPLLLYNITLELMTIFGLNFGEVEQYLIVWVFKQNKLFDFYAYWKGESMDTMKITSIN